MTAYILPLTQRNPGRPSFVAPRGILPTRAGDWYRIRCRESTAKPGRPPPSQKIWNALKDSRFIFSPAVILAEGVLRG